MDRHLRPTPISSPISEDWVAARTGGGGSLAVGWLRGDDLHIRQAEFIELATGRVVATFEASGAACCIWDARLDAAGTHAVFSAAVNEGLTGQSFTFVDVRSGQVTGQVTVNDRAVDYFPYDLSTDGESVAVVTPERVEIWHRTRGLVASLAQEGGDFATAVAFVSDDELAVSFAGEQPRLAVFDTGSWRLDRELAVPGALSSLAVDPLGHVLVGGGQDGMLARWQLPDWEVLPTWNAGVGTVAELAVAVDGSVLATGLASAVALLDPMGNAIGTPMALDSHIRPVSFADDGDAALIATATGVRRFELDPLAWEETACVLAGRVLDEREWADHVGDEPYRPVCPG